MLHQFLFPVLTGFILEIGRFWDAGNFQENTVISWLTVQNYRMAN